ncbi:MAG: hypothetical protein PF590_03115 [Candidatus Delongbacteria bacterium]|nr:hypothetical protein [Candidatus Delongbacteria bacterium]
MLLCHNVWLYSTCYVKYSNAYFPALSSVTIGKKYVLIPAENRSLIFTLPKTYSIYRCLENNLIVFCACHEYKKENVS